MELFRKFPEKPFLELTFEDGERCSSACNQEIIKGKPYILFSS